MSENNGLNPAIQANPFRTTLLLCATVLLLAAAVRIPWLNTHGYLLDELWTAELATGRGSAHQHIPTGQIIPALELFTLTDAPPWWRVWTTMECTHPPLYFLTLRLWMNAFGQGDGRERLLSVFASLIAIGLLFDTVRLLSGRTPAFWAALLMAVSQPQIDYARETRNYAMLLATAMLAANALVRIEKLGFTWRRWATLLTGVLTTALTHYFSLGFLAAIGIYAMLRTNGRDRLRLVFAFAAASVLFVCMWGPFLWKQRTLASTDDPTTRFLAETDSAQPLRAVGRAAIMPIRLLVDTDHSYLPFYFAGALYFVPFLLCRRRPDMLLWGMMLAGTVGFILLLDVSRHTGHLWFIRYTLLAGPAAYALVPLLFNFKGRFRWISPAVCGTAVAGCLIALPSVYRSWPASNSEIAREIGPVINSSDLLISVDSGGAMSGLSGSQYMSLARSVWPIKSDILLLNGRATAELRAKLGTLRSAVVITEPGRTPRLPGMHIVADRPYSGRGDIFLFKSNSP